MSKKSAKIAALIEDCAGEGLDPHYVGYFRLFNQELFYEAHDVLEELWLADRAGPNYSFYKGLIQLAGAFVHLQKQRLKPAGALFNLAHGNLSKYPCEHERLDLTSVLGMIAGWLRMLEQSNWAANPLERISAPKLSLLTGPGEA